MSTENRPMLAKVRAILAKAEDPAASPEEAQAYFAKAAALMAKYGIEQAMLADAKPEIDRPTKRVIVESGSYVLDRVNLLMSINDALGGQSARWRTWDRDARKYVQKVELHGFESTLDRVEMLYTSLMLQALNGMKHGIPGMGESTTAYRKTWLAGFRSAVYRRLTDSERQAAAEADLTLPVGSRSAELVLASRDDAILAQFKAAHPKIRTAAKRRLTGSGWNAGNAAGRRADFGNNHLGNARRAALAG
ncbi:DUF2786 domain-containing protein [Kitasatospora sp. NPDC048343]|uniref:DUF2786 domain-containing protein n=1 Tax=Kitasatospora sp. NPDC048343 TaxID=3154717 RepID=UPI0033D9F2BB